MNRRTELVRQEDVAPARIELASSLKDAKAGQMVVLGRDGDVLSPRGRFVAGLRQATPVALAAGIAGGIATAVTGASLAPALLTVGAATAGYALWNRARWKPYRRVLALVNAHRYADAKALLSSILESPPRGGRVFLLLELARITKRVGETQAALTHYQTVSAITERSGKPARRTYYWLARCGVGACLAVLDRPAEAAAIRAELSDAPSGDFFTTWRRYLTMRIAFSRREWSGGADAELYDWAKDALATNLLGTSLALLVWAFEQAGDEDMARHLLSETPSRLIGSNLESADLALADYLRDAWTRFDFEDELKLPA